VNEGSQGKHLWSDQDTNSVSQWTRDLRGSIYYLRY